jgi:predicted DNA binding protein
MSRTRLRLGLPDDSWLGEASRSASDATLRVTGTVAADEGDVTAVTAAGIDRAAAVDAVRDRDDVDRIETVERGRTEAVVRVTAPAPSYVAAARRAGVPFESPVEVAEGLATLVAVADRERLSAFGRRLAAAGVTVESAGGDDPDPILTESQHDLVRAAIEAGYYDTPRECTLTELAADREIAKSTCSETLHRAEGQVLHRFVEAGARFDATEPETEAAPAVAGSSVDEADDGDVPRGSDATGVTATEP